MRSNIERHGCHIYNVMGGESPRYAYTVGLRERFGMEVVLAGLVTMPVSTAARLLNTLTGLLQQQRPEEISVTVEGFGKFTLLQTDPSWNDRLLLGCYDYYQTDKVRAWQLVPVDEETRTIDVPDMTRPFSPEHHAVWRWLDGGWPHAIPATVQVVTNLDALLGYAVSELMRWEELEWEMFSGPGPDVPEDQMHVVPLATLLAFDSSLSPALEIPVGSGLFREFEEDVPGRWQPWEQAKTR
jgi:hypothetical protein